MSRALCWSWVIIITWWRFCFLVYQWTSIVFPPLSVVNPTCRGCIWGKIISVNNCICPCKLHIVPDGCLPWNVKEKEVPESSYLAMGSFSVLADLLVNWWREVDKIFVFLKITFRLRWLSLVLQKLGSIVVNGTCNTPSYHSCFVFAVPLKDWNDKNLEQGEKKSD